MLFILPSLSYRWEGTKGRVSWQTNFSYLFQNPFNIIKHFVIPKPQNPITLRFEPIVPFLVARVIGVLSAVNLNNDLSIVTDKIGYITSDRILPPELNPFKLFRP